MKRFHYLGVATTFLTGFFLLTLLTISPPAGAQSCGELGGDYCSQSSRCPNSYDSLGSSWDCHPCCKEQPPSGPSCGELGGDYCSQSGRCPSGYDSLGSSWDCNPCCKEQPPLPSCGALGGDYCSQSGSCPSGYGSLGSSFDCHPCCKKQPPSGPSCGELGGSYCSQSGSCPEGYDSMGFSWDCNPCCKQMAPTDDDAQAVSHTIPGRLAAGWSYNVAVTMLNTGISTWTRDGKGPPDGSQGYKLGAKSGLLLPFDTRILLPPDVNVASQDSHDFEFEILAPFETGVYCAVLQMIHGEVWFGQPLEVCVEIGIGPVVTDITPASGPPGTVVTISGQNFRPETEVWFSFGDPSHRAYSRVPVNYSWESPSQIAFTVPDDAGCGYHFVSLADPETPTEEGPTLVVTPPVEFVVTAPCNPARRNSFDVVSYNIRMLPDEACLIDDKDTHKCHKDYRAPLIARHPLLQDHDAIVFVEAFSDRHRSEITIMLSGEYPYVGSVLGREHWPGREDGGVIILSKWPIEWEAETVFKDRTGVDWWADKGVKYARINKAGQRYHIFGTHLDSSQNEGDRAVRTLQLRQMASFIKEQSLAIGEAVLMAGDFNIDRNGKSGPFYSEYERMLTTLNASQPPIQGFHFSTNPDGQWLDYVLYSNTHLQPGRSGNLVLMPRDGAGGDLSDHYAVLGSFVFSIPENLAVDFSKAPTETPTGGGPPGTVGTPSPIFSWDEVAGADSNALDLTQRR